MKRALALLLAAWPLAAADGTVVNGTGGKPAAGVIVTLYKLGQGGMSPVETVKTDAQGRFATKADAQGPHLLQVIFDGVVYSRMLPPGSPSTGLTVDVYNSSRQAGPARVAQHMVLLEPSGSQLNVSETYIFNNDGKTTFNNPAEGTLRFWMPAAAKGIVQVNATAPGGMPVQRPAEKTAKSGVYKVDFPIKPGETRIDLRYLVPFQDNGTFEGKVLYTGQGPTRLVAPNGVTLAGDGLQSLGAEPQSQAAIYEVKGDSYQVRIQGTGSLAAAQNADTQDSGPQIEQVMPKVWDNVRLILGLALGILALGFILLYRADAQGKHEQRRRG